MKTEQEYICDLAEKISMPDVYLKIRYLMGNPSTKIEDYVALLQADSILAIRIIRIANSHYFGFNRKADDLYDAISLIGIMQLHDLMLSSLCMRTFSNIPEQVLNFNSFWLHGVKCGIVSRSIARICRLPTYNRFFTLGLLLEIGHAAMFVKTPELALTALLESQKQKRSIDKVEQEYFGFNYCQLGTALLHQWHLPEVYTHSIEHHLYPENAKKVFQTSTIILNLAHHYFDDPGNFTAYANRALAGHIQRTELPSGFEELIAAEVVNNTDQVFAMLCPPKLNGMAMVNTVT